MPKFLPFYEHSSDEVMGLYPDGKSVSWGKFYSDVKTIADQIKADDIVLACGDIYNFTVGFMALVHINVNISLPPNLQNKTLQDIADSTDAKILDDAMVEALLKKPQIEEETLKSLHRANMESIITLYTSGSSGTPTAVIRPLWALQAEVSMFHKRWGHRIKGGVFAASVAYYHAYGLPFYIVWALEAGEPIALQQIGYPEELMHYAKERHINFIAAPAFFKRHYDFFSAKKNKNEDLSHLKFVTSAGSPLPRELSQNLKNVLPAPVVEIYGSTETGAVATRSGGDKRWQCLEGVLIERDENGHACVSSPVTGKQVIVTLQDRIEIHDDDHFVLKGRSDRIVKIFEKRISLDALEAKCCAHEWIEAISAVLLPPSERLGAAAILTDLGKAELKRIGRREFINTLREYLSANFDLVILPRKWRFVNDLPINDMGKVHNISLRALFDDKQLE